jgi:uncharacterized protein (DUF2267 family)
LLLNDYGKIRIERQGEAFMRYNEFLNHIKTHTGLASVDKAEELASATLEVLGQLMFNTDRRLVVTYFPQSIQNAVLAHPPEQDFGWEEFYGRVAAKTGHDPHATMEQVQVVLQALSALMGVEGWTLLLLRLPAAYARVLQAQESAFEDHQSPPPLKGVQVTVSSNGSTLATGRAPTDQPISDARADLAHSNSVARNSNPRKDRKLSSCDGIPTRGTSLSTGEPGSSRSLSQYNS